MCNGYIIHYTEDKYYIGVEKMSNTDFENQMIQAIRNKVISEIHKTDFTKLDYNQKKVIPDGFINKVWDGIDWDKVIEDTKEEMHKRICNAVIGNMETEIKTDVKNILSIDGVRQKLRVEVYPAIMKVLDNK